MSVVPVHTSAKGEIAQRAFDVIVAGLGLLVVSPALLIIALAVAVESRGGVLFRHLRVGRDGNPFRVLKFRTMVAGAERTGGPLTVGRDPRVTRLGGLLRKSKLDELPQLVNVLRGEMSLVGPRPEVPRYVAHYDREQLRVLTVRPGITDPASIAYRYESEQLAGHADPERAYVEVIMPRKLQLNLEYLERRTVLTDVGILLRTVGAVVGRRAPRRVEHRSLQSQ